MGVDVIFATLPQGIDVGRCYMSFRGEVIYISQCGDQKWLISSQYRILSNVYDTSVGGSDVLRIPIKVEVSNLDRNPYEVLYEALTKQYTNSQPDLRPRSELVDTSMSASISVMPNVATGQVVTQNIPV
jgi:hypothetical protein